MRYVHPKLWIEVDTNLHVKWPDNPEVFIGVRYDMLKDMWFEQVEEIPEWIHKAAEALNETWAWRVYKWDRLEQLAKAILDNIPKVTMEDIEDWLRSIDTLRGYNYSYTRWFITNALRNKWLLQE